MPASVSPFCPGTHLGDSDVLLRIDRANKSSGGRVKKMKYSVQGYAGLVRRNEYVLKG